MTMPRARNSSSMARVTSPVARPKSSDIATGPHCKPPVCRQRFSPDVNAIPRCKVQLIARLDVEGRVPRIDIAHDSVDAEGRRTMGIRHHLVAKLFVANEGVPALSSGEEETLIAGEAGEHRSLLTVE
jgi:hypothetical protein